MSTRDGGRRASSQPSEKKILVNFYSKVSQIIAQSRQSDLDLTSKTNMWFNIGMMNAGSVLSLTEPWTGPKPDLDRPMSIEVAVDASTLPTTQVLLLNGKGAEPNSRYVVLEHWSLSIDKAAGAQKEYKEEVAEFYKRLIIMIRSLCTYTHSTPAFRAYRRQKVSKSGGLRFVCRFTSSVLIPQELGHPSEVGRFSLGDIQTPFGHLELKVAYRKQVDLTIGEHEQLLSSLYIEAYLNHDQQRDNASSCPQQTYANSANRNESYHSPMPAEAIGASSSGSTLGQAHRHNATYTQHYTMGAPRTPHSSHPFSPTEDNDYFSYSPQRRAGSYIPAKYKYLDDANQETQSDRPSPMSGSSRQRSYSCRGHDGELGSSVPIERGSYLDGTPDGYTKHPGSSSPFGGPSHSRTQNTDTRDARHHGNQHSYSSNTHYSPGTTPGTSSSHTNTYDSSSTHAPTPTRENSSNHDNRQAYANPHSRRAPPSNTLAHTRSDGPGYLGNQHPNTRTGKKNGIGDSHSRASLEHNVSNFGPQGHAYGSEQAQAQSRAQGLSHTQSQGTNGRGYERAIERERDGEWGASQAHTGTHAQAHAQAQTQTRMAERSRGQSGVERDADGLRRGSAARTHSDEYRESAGSYEPEGRRMYYPGESPDVTGRDRSLVDQRQHRATVGSYDTAPSGSSASPNFGSSIRVTSPSGSVSRHHNVTGTPIGYSRRSSSPGVCFEGQLGTSVPIEIGGNYPEPSHRKNSVPFNGRLNSLRSVGTAPAMRDDLIRTAEPQLSFGVSPEPKDDMGGFLQQLDASQNTMLFQNDTSSSVSQLTQELQEYRDMASSFMALSAMSPTFGMDELSLTPHDNRKDQTCFTPDLPFGSPSPTHVSGGDRFIY